MKKIILLLILCPSLIWANHENIEFDSWSQHSSQVILVYVYNKLSKTSINANSYSFEVKFNDGTSRIYRTDSYDYCSPQSECTWRIDFTTPKDPITLRLVHTN